MNLKRRIGLVLGLALAVGATAYAGAVLNVRDFGAVGDGVADDFPAIQRAFDKANDCRIADGKRLGGSSEGVTAPVVFLPKGKYRVSRTLVATTGVTMRGEGTDSVLTTDREDILILYLHMAYRCVVRDLTFRGGDGHVAFWSKNRDRVTITLEGCRFENSRAAAFWTESWSTKKPTSSTDVEMDRMELVGPFDMSRDTEGLPVLKRTSWTAGVANSSRVAIRNCTFRNCGSMFRGAVDGTYLSNLKFVSTRVQTLPVIQISNTAEMCDVELTANLPDDYAYGWIEGSIRGDLRRVTARSTGAAGAPLLATAFRPRSENMWAYPGLVRLEDCSVQVAPSKANALVWHRRCEPALMYVSGCRELNAKPVDMFRLGRQPKTVEEMREVDASWGNLPLERTHKWMVEGNGPEIAVNVPENFRCFLEKPLDPAIVSSYPDVDRPIVDPLPEPGTVIDAADFGLTLESYKRNDTDEMERIFAAAAAATNPVVRFPSRTIVLHRTIEIPRRVRIQGEGRACFIGVTGKDLFRVREGEGPIAITFMDVGFRDGRFGCVAEGSGSILFKSGIMHNSRGFLVRRRGAGRLALDIVDLSTLSPQILESEGADVRIRDSWLTSTPKPDVRHFMVNRGGTLLCEHILGVPYLGVWNGTYFETRMEGFREGENAAWILNDSGIVRTRDFRYGGEFGGCTAVATAGVGSRTFLEGSYAQCRNKTGSLGIVENFDPTAEIVYNYVICASYEPPHTMIKGVAPARLFVRGWRNGREPEFIGVQGVEVR